MLPEQLKPSWGVLLAQHQRHKMVIEGLTDCQVQHFLPMVEDTIIINGRHVHKQRPLLGRYILFAINDIWKKLASLRGVSGMLLDADKLFPAQVEDAALDAIRSMCVDNVYSPCAVESRNGFFYGQRVTIETGPMAYHIGRYDGHASKNRDAALFNLFGREQRVTFKTGELIAA